MVSFFKRIGRGIGNFFKGAGRVAKNVISPIAKVVAGATGVVQKVLNSPLGQTALNAIKSNPALAPFAIAVEKGVNVSEALARLGSEQNIENVKRLVQTVR